eukprot:Skav229588  [mRNA]  locus=scaffold510:107658:107915:- [translate_table: standard]
MYECKLVYLWLPAANLCIFALKDWASQGKGWGIATTHALQTGGIPLSRHSAPFWFAERHCMQGTQQERGKPIVSERRNFFLTPAW